MKIFTFTVCLSAIFFANSAFSQVTTTQPNENQRLKGKSSGYSPAIRTIDPQLNKEFLNNDDIKINSTRQVIKIKPNEVNSWRADINGNKQQYLHIRVKKRFQVKSLLKVLTPFAVAKIINRTSTNITSNSTEIESVNNGLPVNIAAGVVATGIGASDLKKGRNSKVFINFYGKDGRVRRTKFWSIPDGREVIIPMKVCDPGPQIASIDVISTNGKKIGISIDTLVTNTLSENNKVSVFYDGEPPCEDTPGGVINDGPGRTLLTQWFGMMNRNVEITWSNGYTNLNSTSYIAGVTMGVSFQQTSQRTTYDYSTGNIIFTIYGVQSYSMGMGPVQGTVYSESISVSGQYNPTSGSWTMLSQ